MYPDGSSLYYYHGLTRALTPTGAEQASSLQRMAGATLLTLRVIKPDGRVVIPHELDPRSADTPLADVDAGDLVEEEFVAAVAPAGPTRRGHLPPFVYRFADPERAFGRSEYVLLVPPSLQIQVDGQLEGLEFSEERHGELRRLLWRAERVAPVAPEPFAPPGQELLPWVTYGFGVSWQDVGDAVRDRMLDVLRVTGELETWSAPLLGGDEPLAAVRRLVAGVCDEVDAGDSVLDLGASGGESFSRRRGNRLGVVAAALAAAGFDLDLVLTRPLELAHTHLAVPSNDAFVVPVLRVRHGGEEIWIDLGEERAGVGRLSPAFQGSDALVLPLTRTDLPVTYLETLPRFPNPQLEERFGLRARLDAAGSARLDLTITLRGAQAERTVSRLRGLPEERVGMAYSQIAGGLFPGATNVRGRLERGEEEVRLLFELDLDRACEVEGDAMTCRTLTLARPLSPVLASLPERRFPLVVDLPLIQVIELEIEPPPDWSEERPPRRLTTDWGSVGEELGRIDGRLRSTLRLEVPAQVVAPSDYAAFARFCHAVDELAARPPILRRLGPGQ